jgi:hypothetical protein
MDWRLTMSCKHNYVGDASPVVLHKISPTCKSHLPTHLKAMMVAEPNAVLRVAVQVVPEAHGGAPRLRKAPPPRGPHQPQQQFPHR